MSTKVLVAYASKLGATAEIAEKIGEALRRNGLEADVLPVGRVRDLTPYGAVIIGSAVYYGRWRKGAVKFLEKNKKLLTERRVWLFSSGPTGVGDPVDLTKGWRFPKALQPIIDSIRPRDIAVFHGRMDPKTLGPFQKWVLKKVKAPLGDFRDWDAVGSWAAAIAAALKK